MEKNPSETQLAWAAGMVGGRNLSGSKITVERERLLNSMRFFNLKGERNENLNRRANL